jgi:hypothetical protein
LISPDVDFSATGALSGIKYSEAFKKYKEMLIETPDSPVFKRIFSQINESLFGTAPAPIIETVAEDGDYDSELEQFRAELLEDPPAENCPSSSIGESTQPIHSLGNLLPISDLPAPQSERCVSISVTSNISMQTAAASSQVSNFVSNSITLPAPESEAEETTSPKPPQPLPKKKGSKSSKKAVVAPRSGTPDDVAPVPLKKTAKKSDSIKPPTRVLRNHG